MRLGTMLLALLVLAGCGAAPADPRPPASQREVAGARLAPYALGKSQVGHVLRYLEPPRGFRVTDYCLDGESERCDQVLEGVRWSSYTTLESGRDLLLVGVVRHRDAAGAASALRGIADALDTALPPPDAGAWRAVGGEVRSRGWTSLSDGYQRGPWTVQVLGGTLPARAASLRRTTHQLGRAVLADLDADYATLLDRRRS